MDLNDSQLSACRQLEGPLMVLAGPGSGKTTVITYRTLQLIRKGGVLPRQILVITFSKAAATEMENRFRAAYARNDTGSGSGPRPSCTFGTFHAVFFRVLRKRYGYDLNHVLQEGERREMIKRLLNKFGFDAGEDMLFSILSEISLVKNELQDLQYYNSSAMGTDEFRHLFMEYEELKHAQNKIDFDDMLTLCYRLWQQEPSCLLYWQQRFPYIMIDEFQDINHVQYECMRMLSATPHHLCVVGDDDQSIYRFRGARPEFLLQFPKDFPQVKKVVLDTNYRSTDPIIAFSNSLIAQNQVRYHKTIIGTQKKGPSHQIIKCADQNQEAAFVAKQIKNHEEKSLAKQNHAYRNHAYKNNEYLNEYLNEIAVIYRTNIQARAFVDAFMQNNIPYVVKDEISVIYEHWIALDIFAYLRLGQAFKKGSLPDPKDIERIINKPFRFISKAFLQKARQEKCDIFEWYHQSGMLNSPQQQRIEELIWHLKEINKISTTDAINFIRNKAGYDDHIRNYCEYRKLNPGGLYEIASEIQEASRIFPDASAFLDHGEEAINNKNIKDNDERGRVTLTTMHSAKGLEFDIVYIAGAVEGLIPHERSRTAAEIEEERRLLYVGATRARHNLYISVIKKRHEKNVEPSRFLKKL